MHGKSTQGRLAAIAATVVMAMAAAPLPGQDLALSPVSAQRVSSTLTGARFEGSVPGAKVVPGLLPLSLREAVRLGLENNLGLLLAREGITSARGERWLELSRLLPNIAASGSAHHERENLAITGISLPNVPMVVGPFNYYDVRLFLTQRIFDLEAFKRLRSAKYQLAAAELSQKDAGELVVVAVGSAYLQALAGYARVETVAAQLATANVILGRAVEMHKAGVTPGIDELRARVEQLARTQQLIVAENDLAKDKLVLVRLIGLPVGQEIVLTDRSPFEPLVTGSPEELLADALRRRDDYRASEHLLKAAEASREAAWAERLPTLVVDADFGYTGVSLPTLKDTYHIVGSLRFPIFQGGRVHGDELRAEALVNQRRDELADLRGRIEFELRSSLLDIQAAAKQVEVAARNVELAELALSQAQERFSAGINDNLEVVQAQQSVAAAHEALVSSQYQHNLAKLLLAKALGLASGAGIGGM